MAVESPAAPAVPGAGGGTQAPEGFVPQADLDRERERARTFQSELDRTKGLLAEATRAPASVPVVAPPAGTEGFDPDSFRRTLLQDVASVSRMAQSVSALKLEFPYADSSLFDHLDEYGSVEALRLAAEASHARVAGLVDQNTDAAAIEARIRAEYDKTYGVQGTPPGGVPPGGTGDPTPEELASKTPQELHELERSSPGLLDRVLKAN